MHNFDFLIHLAMTGILHFSKSDISCYSYAMFHEIGKIRILTNASFSKIGKLQALKHILVDSTLVFLSLAVHYINFNLIFINCL